MHATIRHAAVRPRLRHFEFAFHQVLVALLVSSMAENQQVRVWLRRALLALAAEAARMGAEAVCREAVEALMWQGLRDAARLRREERRRWDQREVPWLVP